MGTYTTNYNLFMPSHGEQGWGDLVNDNFSTIDATMKGLDTRIGTLETEAETLDSRTRTLENTIPEEGMIVATKTIDAQEGVYGRLYINGVLTTDNSGTQYASVTSTVQSTSIAQIGGGTKTSDAITVEGIINKLNDVPYPIRISPGIYIKSDEYVTGDINTVLSQVTRTATVKFTSTIGTAGTQAHLAFYVNGVQVDTLTTKYENYTVTSTHEVSIGSTCYIEIYIPSNYTSIYNTSGSISISDETKYIYFVPE